MIPFVVVLALLGIPKAPAAGVKPTAIVTIIQGSATVIRANNEFATLEGLRVLSDDLIRTDKDSFVRIEYEDQTWIELGPETQVELGYPTDKRATRPALYLLSGWVKIGCPKSETAKRALGLNGMDLVDLSGTLVIRAAEPIHTIFAEQGSARWIDRAPHGAEAVSLKRSDYLVTGQSKVPTLQNRPAPEFVSSMPIPYRDTLPIRYALFATRAVAIKDPHPFSYADVEPWLNAEPTVRRQFVALWRRKAAQDETFRTSLDHNMSMHPEWDPVLHPEKYEPKDPPAAVNPSTLPSSIAPVRTN